MTGERLWRTYNAFHKRKAQQFAPSIYKALQAQIKYYTQTNDLNNLPTQQMQEVLTNLYSTTGRQWAVFTFYNILKDAGVKYQAPLINVKRRAAIGLNEEFIQAILDFFNVDLFNTVTNITETTRVFLRETVAAGIEQQLSLDEIINNLLRSDISRIRAALIARTETGKAANAAEQIGTDKTNLQTRKIWLAVNDFRTRFHHIEVDNQVREDGKPFDVGGYLMQRPGSTKSEDGRKVPASELCNCRCCIGREVLRDKQTGLPLRKVNLP